MARRCLQQYKSGKKAGRCKKWSGTSTKRKTTKRRAKSSGTVHQCAVTLGRRGGKATARRR